jgi:hypothetical protein
MWKDRWQVDDDLADPDHDGLANLLEYALNRLPLEPDARNVLTISGSALILEHEINPAVTEVQLSVESSSDMAAWSNVDLEPEISEIESRKRYRLPMGGAPYFRLRAVVTE